MDECISGMGEKIDSKSLCARANNSRVDVGLFRTFDFISSAVLYTCQTISNI